MREDILPMSPKERQRKAVLEAVKEGFLTLKEAAERMNITTRQARRVLRKYEKEGDQGLIHGHRGKPSNHIRNSQLKTLILKLYQAKYMGFGPTLAAEKLNEKGYKLIAETLRLWLKAEGLWDEKRKRSSYRKQRKRKELLAAFAGLFPPKNLISTGWFSERGFFNAFSNGRQKA